MVLKIEYMYSKSTTDSHPQIYHKVFSWNMLSNLKAKKKKKYIRLLIHKRDYDCLSFV